jgi:hypothetical protein
MAFVPPFAFRSTSFFDQAKEYHRIPHEILDLIRRQDFEYLSVGDFMEREQRIIIRFLYKEHAESRDIHARLSAQFGDAADSLRSVQRWRQCIR